MQDYIILRHIFLHLISLLLKIAVRILCQTQIKNVVILWRFFSVSFLYLNKYITTLSEMNFYTTVSFSQFSALFTREFASGNSYPNIAYITQI